MLLSSVLLCACTSPEQDAQIRLFWIQQYAKLMASKAEKQLQNAADNPQLRQAIQLLQAQLQTQMSASQTPAENAQTGPSTKNSVQQPAAAPKTQTAQPARKAKPAPQIMDVTLDNESLPGKASAQDRAKMKKALEEVQLSNQSTLNDIATAFGEEVKYQAFLLTAETERKLKQAAAKSANYAAYSATQKRLLQAQNKALNQLMQQNAHNLKNLRR